MSTRRDKPGPRPTALGDVLDGTRRVTLQRARAAVDRDTWRRAVGRRIAERTDVGQLKQGELTVYVASAAWAQELSLLTREIIERLLAHGVRAEKVRFRVKVQQATEPKPARPLAKPAPPQKPLPAELRAHLDRVADDELRGAIAGAAELALSRLAGPSRAQQPIAPAPQAVRSPRAGTEATSAAQGARSARAVPEATSSAPQGARGPRAVGEITSTLQAARSLRAVAERSAPKDQSSAASRASRPRKREDR